MKFALYCRQRGEEEFTRTVVNYLKQQGCDVTVHGNYPSVDGCLECYNTHQDLAKQGPIDFMVSIGGDGSFIDAANLVGDLDIPLVGINTGRIGFLSGIKKENFKECLQMLEQGRFTLEERSLLHIESSEPLALSHSFVINDITVRATDADAINAITVRAGEQKVNTYWADGLIIATPTGSTAYSMSCGGPILHPRSDVQVLTPIASHSLSVRPIVIPADIELTVEVSSRTGNYSLALDTERLVVPDHVKLHIRKEQFYIQTVLFENTDFYDIIREKLLWGLDKRNG
ncbi:MAG: NAD(+)/NADH kinase [Bacteroidales bacterium]|nr:NAD(+)/NADH kinase [Bacteroidales bacterium]